jgi:hypothetical protein
MGNLLGGFPILATYIRVPFLIPDVKQILFWQFPQFEYNFAIDIITPGFHWLPPNPPGFNFC